MTHCVYLYLENGSKEKEGVDETLVQSKALKKKRAGVGTVGKAGGGRRGRTRKNKRKPAAPSKQKLSSEINSAPSKEKEDEDDAQKVDSKTVTKEIIHPVWF